MATQFRTRRFLLLAWIPFVVSCFTAGTIFGDELTARVTGPKTQYTAKSLETCDDCWLHVKFVEGSDVSLVAGLERTFADATGKDVEVINELCKQASSVKATFPGDRDRFRVYKQRGEARSGVEGPDLGLWFNIQFDADRAALAERLNTLNELDVVEVAHPIPRVELACVRSPAPKLLLAGATPDYTAMQGYLYDAPFGLNAPAAWALPGGRGAGMKFVDVEGGWYFDHEDWNQNNFFYSGEFMNLDAGFFEHGTAVMGEVVGDDNDFGIVGFASDTQYGGVAIDLDEYPIVAPYFLEAAEALDPGDVWLIELQMFPDGFNATPMEYLQVNYDVIWTSSFSLDVVCVEAGANGSEDLDRAEYGGLFDRNVRDSGAVLVAAGLPNSLTAEFFTDYGSRIDVHAWGSSIVTTGYGDLQNGLPEFRYTSGFGGTSGASPMVVGSILCIQGVNKANTGKALLPLEIRQLITDTGTPHTDTIEIGPRPNIGAAIAALSTTMTVIPTSIDVTRGTLFSGSVNDLANSDDDDLAAQRSAISVFPSVWIEVEGTSPTANPSELSVRLEGSVFARTTVNQRIDLYDFVAEQFVDLGGGEASRFTDNVQEVDATGELSRFIESTSGLIRARVRYDSVRARQRYTANVDQIEWTISN